MSPPVPSRVRRPVPWWVVVVVMVAVSRLVLSAVGVVALGASSDDRSPESLAAHALLESARAEVSSSAWVHQWYSWDALHYEDLSRR